MRGKRVIHSPPKAVGLCRGSGRICSLRIKIYFVRQICAKSYQILSAAAPDCFIFCHSTPHSRMRLRDAGGRLRGWGGGSSMGSPDGTEEFAGKETGGAEGAGTVASSPPTSGGRTGGKGTTKEARGLIGESSARAGDGANAAPASKTSRVSVRVKTFQRNEDLRAFTVSASPAIRRGTCPRAREWLMMEMSGGGLASGGSVAPEKTALPSPLAPSLSSSRSIPRPVPAPRQNRPPAKTPPSSRVWAAD